jgi:hypothetical protein
MSLSFYKPKRNTEKMYTVRWTKFGVEYTNFFHAAATERFRTNTITTLVAEDGTKAPLMMIKQ